MVPILDISPEKIKILNRQVMFIVALFRDVINIQYICTRAHTSI